MSQPPAIDDTPDPTQPGPPLSPISEHLRKRLRILALVAIIFPVLMCTGVVLSEWSLHKHLAATEEFHPEFYSLYETFLRYFAFRAPFPLFSLLSMISGLSLYIAPSRLLALAVGASLAPVGCSAVFHLCGYSMQFGLF